MTYEEAQKILGRAREGLSCTKREIYTALTFTRDIGIYAPMRSEGVDQAVPLQDWRARVRERAILVGRSKK